MAGRDKVAPCVTTTPFCSTVCRPGALTVTVYEPGGTDGNLKKPLLLETDSRVALLDSFFNTMLALGRTAPEASVTGARIEPLENCARTRGCKTIGRGTSTA